MAKKRSNPPAHAPGLTFENLVRSIRGIDADLAHQAARAVNLSLTLRNWLIGCHIELYDRRGLDRAQYGEKLMSRLADQLTRQGVCRCDRRELYRYRSFYLAYPRIVEALPPQFKSIVAAARKSLGSGRQSADPAIAESAPPLFGIAAKELITKLSFSHFVALPFLSARPVEKGLHAPGHLADPIDRVADGIRRPIQVQDQSVPQALG
jgi:DUF1016 N-terminal domain